MNRTFTLLLALFFLVTLSAQKSTVDEALTPESPASRLKKEFFKQLEKPGQLHKPEAVEIRVLDFNVESGVPYAGIDEAQAARSGSAAAKQRLDSIVSMKSKTIYEYDGDGNILSTVYYKRDTISDPWMPDFKEETIFDENGRTSMTADYYWVDSLQQWVGDWKTEYTRDENGRTTRRESFEWDHTDGKWISYEKMEYAFDQDGNQTDFSVYSWDEGLGEWVGEYTEHYNFDAEGNVTSSTSSRVWDAVGKEFKSEYKMEFTLDANGMVISWEESQWNEGSGTWVKTLKGDNTFDGNGNYTSYIWSEWDTIANEWVFTSKFENAFDANDNQTSNVSSFWNADSNRWENAQKWEYIFVNGNHTSTVFSIWNPVLEDWMATAKTEYTYNADGDLTLKIDYQWDLMTQQWVQTYKKENSYDANGWRTLTSQSAWNADSNKWIMQSKYERTYLEDGFNDYSASYGWDYLLNRMIGWNRWEATPDAYGNTHILIVSVWDKDTEDWVERNKTEYTYDYAYTWQDLLTPLYGKYKITRRIESQFQNTELKSGEWIVVDDFTYHYSDLAVSSVDDVQKGELSIYPNPASEYIQVVGDVDTDAARILMYDVSGKIVVNRVLDNGGRIPVSHLSRGIYVVRLVQGSKVKTGKIMIE